jgi:serine/threonine protein kinase
MNSSNTTPISLKVCKTLETLDNSSLSSDAISILSELYELPEEYSKFITLNRCIGSGAFGKVWNVTDATLIRTKAGNKRGEALKEIVVSSSEHLMVLQEMHTMCKTKAKRIPGTIEVYGLYKSAGNLKNAGSEPIICYILMELAEESLENIIAYKRRPDESISYDIDVIKQISTGLRELHAKGIAHNDIKPENILRVGTQWKLSDFGLSCTTPCSSTSGTRGYVDPLIHKGLATNGPNADMYSLGVTMYQLFYRKNYTNCLMLMGVLIKHHEKIMEEAKAKSEIKVVPEYVRMLLEELLDPQNCARPTAGDVYDTLDGDEKILIKSLRDQKCSDNKLHNNILKQEARLDTNCSIKNGRQRGCDDVAAPDPSEQRYIMTEFIKGVIEDRLELWDGEVSLTDIKRECESELKFNCGIDRTTWDSKKFTLIPEVFNKVMNERKSNSLKGGKPQPTNLKQSQQTVSYKGKTRRIWLGPRGRKYIKFNNQFIAYSTKAK